MLCDQRFARRFAFLTPSFFATFFVLFFALRFFFPVTVLDMCLSQRANDSSAQASLCTNCVCEQAVASNGNDDPLQERTELTC